MVIQLIACTQLMFGVDSNLHLYHGSYTKHVPFAKRQSGGREFCSLFTAQQDSAQGPTLSTASFYNWHNGVICSPSCVPPKAVSVRRRVPLLIHTKAPHGLAEAPTVKMAYTVYLNPQLITATLWGGSYHAHFTAEEPASLRVSHITQPVGGKAGIEPRSAVPKHLQRCSGADDEKLYGYQCQSDLTTLTYSPRENSCRGIFPKSPYAPSSQLCSKISM